jgi:hypothetical protein
MMVRSRRYAGGIEVALPIEDLVREAFAALSGGTLRLEVRDVLANDEHAVTLATVHGGRASPAAGTPWRLYLPHHRCKPTEAWRKA